MSVVLTPCSPETREALLALISRAFGIDDGYKELNGAISAAAGFDMFDRIGMPDSPMRLVVAETATAVEAGGTQAACLEALFGAYPGNFELRQWVTANQPTLLPQVSDAQFETARAAYEKDRQERRVKIIAANLSAVGDTIALRQEQKQISREMIDRLEDLNGYKSIHDVLHDLQMTVLIEFDRIAGPTIDPDDRRGSMVNQVQALELARDRVGGFASEFAAPAQGSAVCAGIIQALEGLLVGIAAEDAGLDRAPRRAYMILRAMLRQQMGLFDDRLVESSKAIPFAKFAQMLRELAEAAPGATPAEAVALQLKTTADALDDTDRRLSRRREVHQLWQRMDAILLNVEELLLGSGRALELVIHWEDIAALLRELSVSGPDEGLDDVVALAAPIDEAAATQFADMSDSLKRKFGYFIRAARLRFQRADNALLRDCQELKRLRAPLEALLEDQ